MIHFDFRMSDLDASNVFDIMHGEACRIGEEALDFKFELLRSQMLPAKERKVIWAKIRWLEAHAKYIKSLIEKMKNTSEPKLVSRKRKTKNGKRHIAASSQALR